MNDEGTTVKVNRGTNQSGMRDYNERLVLTLVRRQDGIAKSEIARITGLSAQTVSVITRSLEESRHLKRGVPMRGKVGQPSVPMSLNPDSAYFLGLKVGRRSSDMVLIDFQGKILGEKKRYYNYPLPDTIIDFAGSASRALKHELDPEARSLIAGLGVATPYDLWNWAAIIGAPESEMNKWRGFDLRSELALACDCDVLVNNDATAACGAELVFGTLKGLRDYLHVYIGFFVGGGLVLNGALHMGRNGTSGALGPMPIPKRGGGSQPLLEVASIVTLEDRILNSGGDASSIWTQDLRWDVPPALLDAWIDEVGTALSCAVASSASVIDLEAVLIDGWLPEKVRARIVERTIAGLTELDLSGLKTPQVRAGTVGPIARSLGAASLQLSERFMVTQNTL